VRAGYVVVEPDSFSTRGHPDGVCTDGSQPIVTFLQRARDAYAALDYAQALPFVDPKRVAVMGGSHGGSTTLSTIMQESRGAERKAPGFVGAIALYPGCGRTVGDWKVARDKEHPEKIAGYAGVFRPQAPLLILIGELDDWTPAEPCRRLFQAAKADGQPIDLVVYPDARHSFDSGAPVLFRAERRNQNKPGGLGATTGGNRDAWLDAVRRVLAFLKERMDAVR
jgi:dienelactone hydrolase